MGERFVRNWLNPVSEEFGCFSEDFLQSLLGFGETVGLRNRIWWRCWWRFRKRRFCRYMRERGNYELRGKKMPQLDAIMSQW